MRRTTLAGAAMAMAALALPAGASAADAIYVATDGGRLLRINSDGPGQIVSNEPFRGLAAGEQVVGLDVRPSDDTLFAVTSANRAVQVNPVTGAVRPAFGPFAPALAGANHGVDFNPVANALRIVSDADQNLRVTREQHHGQRRRPELRRGRPGRRVEPDGHRRRVLQQRPGRVEYDAVRPRHRPRHARPPGPAERGHR